VNKQESRIHLLILIQNQSIIYGTFGEFGRN
jgi:hypothetical protein